MKLYHLFTFDGCLISKFPQRPDNSHIDYRKIIQSTSFNKLPVNQVETQALMSLAIKLSTKIDNTEPNHTARAKEHMIQIRLGVSSWALHWGHNILQCLCPLQLFICLLKKIVLNLGSVWIEFIFVEIENWNWKRCSKIIFKCVSSTVRPIFNEKVAEK